MKNFLFCILGRSGSGKDTLFEGLKAYFPDKKKLISKTTREPRFEGEDCHEFCTEADLVADRAAGQVVAYNKYADNHYWATKQQVDAADFYIVDVPGLIQLKNEYDGDKIIKAIGLKVSPETSLMRMLKRGDSADKVTARLAVDDEAFSGLETICDFCISSDDLEKNETARIVAEYIKAVEGVDNGG